MARLVLLGVPLDGEFADIPESAKAAVRDADFVIAEEKKSAHRLLARSDARGKEFLILNEHTEDAGRAELVKRIAVAHHVVLFSDAGTPCVADPGNRLVDACHAAGITVNTIPGPSSITAALSLSGFYAESFHFAGFPPREKKQRAGFFRRMASMTDTVVLMERPYAMARTVEELAAFGERRMAVTYDIGMQTERVHRGRLADIKQALIQETKAPFVIVVEAAR